MKLTIEIANQQLMRALRAAKPAFRASMKEVVRRGARMAIWKAIGMTPPMSKGRGPSKETQRFAEDLVAGDIRRVLATASYAYETIQSPAAAAAFWFQLKRGGRKTLADRIAGAEAILKNQGTDARLHSVPIVQRADVSLHERARVRGRVKKRARVEQIAISATEINRHIKDKQRRVGFLAAGWMAAADELGERRVPAWIKRHRGKAPSAVKASVSLTRYTLHMINRVGYGASAQLGRIVPYALAAAAGGLRQETKVRLLKAAKRAGFGSSVLSSV